jgi:hypothetical protein
MFVIVGSVSYFLVSDDLVEGNKPISSPIRETAPVSTSTITESDAPVSCPATTENDKPVSPPVRETKPMSPPAILPESDEALSPPANRGLYIRILFLLVTAAVITVACVIYGGTLLRLRSI